MVINVGQYKVEIQRNLDSAAERNDIDIKSNIAFARETLSDVNMWIANCDQKAGLMLTMIGIVATILFSTDFIMDKLSLLVEPIKRTMQGSCHVFSFYRFICIIIIIITFVFMAMSVLELLKSLTANLGENDKPSERRISKSLIFYGTISQMEYNKYEEDIKNTNQEKEILSQIHINSIICNNKFVHYNKGLRWLRLGLLFMAVMLFFLLVLGI